MNRSVAKSAKNKPGIRKKPARRKKAPKPSPGDYALVERKLPGRRFVDIPLMKGRVVDYVEFFTTGDGHILTIQFQDKTALCVDIEPRFELRAELQDRKGGEIEIAREWPAIASEPWQRH